MRKTNKKGFTLVELLVVIAIIAIIAAVAVPVTISQIDKAKKNTAANEANNAISAIQTASVEIKSNPDDYTSGAKGQFNRANLITALNKSFIGIKQITSISITCKQSEKKCTITITTEVALDTPVTAELPLVYVASTDNETQAKTDVIYWSKANSNWADAADVT